MTEQHECEFYVVQRHAGPIWRCDCLRVLLLKEVTSRLNRFTVLKKATDALSAEDARRLSGTCMSMQGKAFHNTKFPTLRESAVAYWKRMVIKLNAYTDALEGK